MKTATPDLAPSDPGCGPSLARAAIENLGGPDLWADTLEARLEDLARVHGNEAYTELIHFCSHLRFEPREARQHWRRIVGHRGEMQARLGSAVDLRVALFSYFMQVERRLVNPKIIERDLFEETRSSAYVDELTGLHNYRYFSECLVREVLRSEQYHQPLSLVMIDVDHFKDYNDRNGHEAGNTALAAIANLLCGALRRVDEPARFGGEEFALLLPSTPKSGAQQVAERTRSMIEDRHVLTISLGVATYPADASDASQLVRHADMALYDAKTGGRNRVCLYEQSTRSYRRTEAMLSGRLDLPGRDGVPLITRSVGEGGMLFHVQTDLPVGLLADAVLLLPGGAEVAGSGRIVNSAQDIRGRFEVVFQFVDMPATHRHRLAAFVRECPPDRSR